MDQFIETIKEVFPNIPANWDREIMHPPFVKNEIVIMKGVKHNRKPENSEDGGKALKSAVNFVFRLIKPES